MEIKALVEFLSKTREELWTWHDSLAPAMQINSARTDKVFVPAVLQLQ